MIPHGSRISHDARHEAVPTLVATAASRASQAGFPMSCDPAVGRSSPLLRANLSR